MNRDFDAAHLLAEEQRKYQNAARAYEGVLRMYLRLRRALEAYGPVEPIKSILDQHTRMLEACGYDDPLERKSQNPK